MHKILVIDIETTGFLQEGGAIVEVGMVSLDLDSGLVEVVFDSVCRESILTAKHREEPLGWIFRNSSLTVEEVREARDLREMLPELQGIVDGFLLGATAYNRNFDFQFLENRGLVFGEKLPCPMELSTPICKLPGKFRDYKWPKVEEAWLHFFPDRPYTELHRGADDARHEAMIVWELYKLGVFKVPGMVHGKQVPMFGRGN